MNIELETINFSERLHCEAIAGLWTGACGPLLALSPQFVAYTLSQYEGAVTTGRFAWEDDEPIGMIVVSAPSAVDKQPDLDHPTTGWITAIATLPECQGRGIGSALLDWGEGWLAEQGCRRALLGGNIRPFVPGLPVELENEAFFAKRGYISEGNCWDMSSNLAHYMPPESLRDVDCIVRPAHSGDVEPLREFLSREFPQRWKTQFEHFLADNGRLSDYMVLWTARGLDGFCQLTFEDSMRTVERFFPYQLPRAWGQFGSVGVSAEQRGKGFGAAIIDAGLRRLHNNGVNGCVIDWTGLLDLYAKFGFETYREYQTLAKALE